MEIMKKKKTILSVAAGVLMLLTLSFGSGASALNDLGHGGGGTVKPPTCTKYPCPIRP